MGMKQMRCFLVALMLLLFSVTVQAQEVTVQGYGKTQEDALHEAFRLAVEKVVGAVVESETLVRNLEVVSDEIYTQSAGFVQDHHVLGVKQADGMFMVNVKVTVNTNPDSALLTKLQQLKLIQRGLRDPRIGVIMPEYHLSSRVYDASGESAIVRKLREAGFKRVVDPKQIDRNQYDAFSKAILKGETAEAVAIATSYQMDYVIVGESFSEYAGSLYGSSVKSCRARTEAKLLKVDTGEIIAANGFEAGGVDISQMIAAKKAVSNAGELLGDYMVKELMKYAGDTEKPLHIIITHVTSFAKLNLIQKELKEIQGIKTVYLRGYSDGLAEFDINFAGSPRVVADALEKVNGVTLQITEISNSVVRAEMR